MEKNCDVFILGAGLSGGTLALQLKKQNPDLEIVICDRKSFPLVVGSGSVGESTVEVASHYLANVVGLKEHLEISQLPKLGLRYFLETKGDLITDRLEIGTNKFSVTPSYQLDRSLLENFIWNKLVANKIETFANSEIVECQFGDEGHSIGIASKDSECVKYRAKWFIDSSGRSSYLKKKLNLKNKSDHECSAAWWKLKGEHRIDHWSKNESWTVRNGADNARWFSTNHLMGEGYWFWLIPLPTNQTSFGIVFDSNIHKFSEINTFDKALEWLRKHEPQAATLIENFKTDQKDFGCLKNYTCEAKELFSASNWAITGEAGVFIDPFYSPGSDFIAIANTYITDLISRSHAGEDIGFRAKLYNKIFLKLYTGTKFTFKDQYEIMGNPLVMPIKVFWDWCFYWNFIARLYFDEKYTDLRYLSKMENVIAQAEALNIKIQDLLNRWNKKERPEIKSGFLDLAGYPYLYGLNAALSEKFEGSDSEFKTEERFKLGICNLELIASEIQNMYDDTDAWDSEPKLEASLNVRNFYKELRGFCDECN